jgi:sugar phosphate isomerase/epimerase
VETVISFMSANYVARAAGYALTEGWAEGDRTTNDRFRPLETFRERFGGLLEDIRALGFDAVDLWTAHLNPAWATPEHIAIASELLAGWRVTSLAGSFGSTPDEFEAACRLAVEVGAPVLGGNTSVDHGSRAALLAEHALRLGIENHPERTPDELLAKIGDGGNGTVGATVDTGWWATHGYDAARAIEELGELVFHVHLKDIRAPGAHDTCSWGEGCVPIEECVRVLRRIGYGGAISVEHEPERSDPSDECRAMGAQLRAWLG